MMRIPETLALKVEKAANKTYDQYGKVWKMADVRTLLKKRNENLEWLSQLGSAALESVTEPITGQFHQRLVELAMIQRCLTGQSSLR